MRTRRCCLLLSSFFLVSVIAYLILNRSYQPTIVLVPPTKGTEIGAAADLSEFPVPRVDNAPTIYVPRGQSYYYTDHSAKRLGSFEVWRPQKLVLESSNREKLWASGPKLLNGANENIFLTMVTNSQSMWKNIPTQQLTLLRKFRHHAIYGNAADSICGEEVVDVLQDLTPSLLEGSKSFETYRILRAIRDSHANIGPEQVTLPEISTLKKFTLLPSLLRTYRENPDHDWFVIVEDNTSLLEKNLREALSSLNPHMPLYLGSAVRGKGLLFASSKAGIILSKRAMKDAFESDDIDLVVNSDYAKQTENECCGDYVLATFLKSRIGLDLDTEKSSTLFQSSSITSVQCGVQNWCSQIVSFADQRPRDMELINEYEAVKAEGSILYSDLYLDFIKPYLLKTPQQNWDNGAKNIELEPKTQSKEHPYAHQSLEECKKACINTPTCVMMRYDSYKHYCGLGTSVIALGKPVLSYDTPPNQEDCRLYGIRCGIRDSAEAMTSIWLFERVRSMRRSQTCDILAEDSKGEGTEYGALDQTEGWWYRAKEK